ncbi:MAG: hypothetical protein BroJett012_09070 [Betaproteobacteria bacterium]|nr:MAG: hypothetical protein BroJett012_09070 [Betaproteobacteria bacterium]
MKYVLRTMKPYKKAFGLAAIAVSAGLTTLLLPSGTSGLALAMYFGLLALVVAGFGIIGCFGQEKTRQWIESNF